MKSFISASLLMASLALADEIPKDVALIDYSEDEIAALQAGVVEEEDLLANKSKSEITFVPEPLAVTNDDADKMPGKWTDEQKLTLETFKEIVAADIENVWVVAYIDPRCRDCLILSVEWEKLTQIEEREKRKIKLGYVDISVEENWKIIQDHTKGKKMTQTPAVTLYGENKESPHWYPKDHPDAKGVHTWVSSYADHFGYGYWSPDEYTGAGVKGSHHDKHGQSGYGAGPRYRTNGKYLAGDQVIQLSKDKNGAVMRRRTVATGGKLSGALHTPQEGYYRSHQPGYGNNRSGGYGGAHAHHGGYGQRPSYGGQYSRSGQSGRYGSYDGRSAYGRSYDGYNRQDRYGRQLNPYYNRHGQRSSGYGDNRYDRYGGSYGGHNQYGGRYGSHGSYAHGGRYGGRGGYGPGYNTHFNGQGHGNALNSYTSRYSPPTPYNKGAQQKGYGDYGSYNNKNRLGSYGNPYQAYHGPGLSHLQKKPYDGFGSARYHEVLGKGIVLGKYTFTDGRTYEVTDFDEKVIAGPDDKAYKQALAIAQMSGKGYSDINFGGYNGHNVNAQYEDEDYIGIEDVKEAEDIPDTYALKQQIDLVNAQKEKAKEQGYEEPSYPPISI